MDKPSAPYRQSRRSSRSLVTDTWLYWVTVQPLCHGAISAQRSCWWGAVWGHLSRRQMSNLSLTGPTCRSSDNRTETLRSGRRGTSIGITEHSIFLSCQMTLKSGFARMASQFEEKSFPQQMARGRMSLTLRPVRCVEIAPTWRLHPIHPIVRQPICKTQPKPNRPDRLAGLWHDRKPAHLSPLQYDWPKGGDVE